MAKKNGTSASRLTDELYMQPAAFRFYQAIRLLENAQGINVPRVGHGKGPEQDSIRFGQHVSLAHLGKDIETCDRRAHKHLGYVHMIKVCFTGLAGPFGPMPEWLTETLVHMSGGIPDQRLFPSSDRGAGLYKTASVKDETLQDFLDLFHNRFFALLYRSWAASNKAVDFDWVKRDQEDVKFNSYISSFFGGWHEDQSAGELRPFSQLAFSGYLAGQTRHAEGLESILSEYFAVSVEIEQCLGHWLPLEENQQISLGSTRDPKQLGVDTFLGKKIWDRQLKFRIKIGPLNSSDFQKFLPSSSNYAELKKWVQIYTGDRLFWDLQLVVSAEDVPNTRLGESGILGQSLWLKSKPMENDNDDVILTPQAA